MKKLVMLFSIIVLASGICLAQTTSFTYQGKLGDAGAPANGSYDFQFKLFDQSAGGTQQGPTLTNTGPTNTGLTVVNGGFTVQLDFGANFTGDDRYLETSVRVHNADPNAAYSTLAPRQRVGSTPYAIRSLNATTADNAINLAGVTAGNYVQTSDTRLSDARTPTAGSANYIQSQSALIQPGNFNISGNGLIGGNVGIGTTTTAPQYKLHVVGGNVRVEGNTTGIFPRFSLNFTGGAAHEKRWQNYAAPNALYFTALNDAENAETFWLQVNRGAGTTISNVVFPNGNVGIGTTNPAATLEVNGYTKLGSDAPLIKVKKLTGTTASTGGDYVDIAHGLDQSKILSVSVLVNYSALHITGPNVQGLGLNFYWFSFGGVIRVLNASGDSASILSKPITILITYEQ